MKSLLVRTLTVTSFASAFLLFWCEPMVGKMVLRFVGGTSAVWSTCVLFFQVMLLAGYLYAHVLGRLRSVRLQVFVHLLLLFSAFTFLPIHFDNRIMGLFGQTPRDPAMWLLTGLIVGAGVPFFVVATTAPLLQNWFSTTGHDSARDPYFLYAASNAGSLAALVIHPFVLDPLFGASVQSQCWFFGYIAVTGLIAAAGYLTWMQGRSARIPVGDAIPIISRLEKRTRVFWVVAAFVPSALMLAVTNHISADVASAPLLWVAPLAAYLLTFVFAFSQDTSSSQASRVIPAVLAVFFAITGGGVTAPPPLNWLVVAAHILLLFGSALVCHTALADSRPLPEHLTEFYFWIALGGVLGGAFTAFLAPMMFRTIFEYPLLVALVPFFRSSVVKNHDQNALGKWKAPAVLGLFAASACVLLSVFKTAFQFQAFVAAQMMFTLAIFRMRERKQLFALAFAALIVTNAIVVPHYIEVGRRVYVARNFFGVKTVLDDSDHKLRTLVHGDTVHGVESVEPTRSGQPLSYYHPSGPVGDVVRIVAINQRRQIGVVGLGTGSMAAYAGPDKPMTFFEIDPQIETIARGYFTFLKRCAEDCRVVIGDGRLELGRIPNDYFTLVVLDAFSSDAIPAHLMSREALQLYSSKLTPDGMLLFHVSNRYLNVVPLVSALVRDAGLVGFLRNDNTGNVHADGKAGSSFIVAARHLEDLEALRADRNWEQLPQSGFRVWTDDYSNLLSLVRFR